MLLLSHLVYVSFWDIVSCLFLCQFFYLNTWFPDDQSCIIHSLTFGKIGSSTPLTPNTGTEHDLKLVTEFPEFNLLQISSLTSFLFAVIFVYIYLNFETFLGYLLSLVMLLLCCWLGFVTLSCIYTQSMKRIPMGGGDGGTQGFPLSAYYCVPVEPKALVASKN
jgi:hypothetical protein